MRHESKEMKFIAPVVVVLVLGGMMYCSRSCDESRSGNADTVPLVGKTVTMHLEDGYAPCGSTTEAYDELMKWGRLRDEQEVRLTVMRTGSVLLTNGMQVKVLEAGFGKTRVRVLSTDQECWVESEFLTR